LCKSSVLKIDIIAAVLLARKTGRPVKVTFTREEEFFAGSCRSPFVVYIKDGVKKDGTLIAREMKVILCAGAYSDTMPFIARNASFGAAGTYRMPNYKWDSYSVYTNTPIMTSLRGLGTPEVLWAIEQQMDILAEKLNIDPVEIRRRNILREGEEHANGEPVHSIGARECLEKVANFIEWDKKPKADGVWKRGKGIALGNKYTMAPSSESAFVKLHEDGILEVRHSLPEIGQGLNTVVAQITAEEFGVSSDRIKVVCSDTAFTPLGFVAASCRSTFYLGNAIRLACQDAKQQIFAIAARKLEASAGDLETRGGRVYVKGAPEKAIMLTDLWTRGSVGGRGEEIMGRGTHFQGAIPEDPETGQSKRIVSYYAHGAQAVEVGVNTETGEVKVLRVGSAYDMGQPINPKMCEQQMEGGISMGISTTLFEDLLMDNGRIINPDFVKYKIQTMMEMPSRENVKTMIAAVPHREGPYGAKGVGEAVMAPTLAAIGNAVYNAVGIRMKDLPITREKVFKALKEAAKS
jgi:CO/xanthine dehydrogenase Mo-binding subunit